MGIPIIGDLVDAVKDVVDKVVVDKGQKMQIDLELAKLEDQAQARLDDLVAKQIDVNNTEAKSGSVFVAGWRPAVGWVGAASLGYSAILYPFLQFGARLAGSHAQFPVLDDSLTLQILFGMLGIGAMRSYEKVKGVSTNDYRDTPAAPQTQKKEAEAVAPTPAKKKFKIF